MWYGSTGRQKNKAQPEDLLTDNMIDRIIGRIEERQAQLEQARLDAEKEKAEEEAKKQAEALARREAEIKASEILAAFIDETDKHLKEIGLLCPAMNGKPCTGKDCISFRAGFTKYVTDYERRGYHVKAIPLSGLPYAHTRQGGSRFGGVLQARCTSEYFPPQTKDFDWMGLWF